MTIKIGICGFGYWGPTLYRTLSSNPNFSVVALADPRVDRLEKVAALNANLRTFSDGKALTEAADVDAVAIATPVATHYGLALNALRNGKHVLVEKPLAATVAEAEELVALAERQNCVLLVDHVYVFHDAVLKLKSLLDDASLGKISYFDSLRVNLGLFQPDMNVLWDLAPHDFSIMDFLFGEQPRDVHATGYCHVNDGLPDIVYVTLHFASKMIAHLNLSWMSPVKARRIAVGGAKQMAVWDDLNLEERLKIYNSGIELQPEDKRDVIVPGYRIGDIFSPRIGSHEPLARLVDHFGRVIRERVPSPVDGNAGLRIVRLLERVQQSLTLNLSSLDRIPR